MPRSAWHRPLSFASALAGILAAWPVHAVQFWQNFLNSSRNTAEGAGFIDKDAPVTLNDYFFGRVGGIINGILAVLGIIFFLLIIYGGFLWMTSAGNENRVDKAKRIILASVIGLAVILLGQVLAFLVIELF